MHLRFTYAYARTRMYDPDTRWRRFARTSVLSLSLSLLSSRQEPVFSPSSRTPVLSRTAPSLLSSLSFAAHQSYPDVEFEVLAIQLGGGGGRMDRDSSLSPFPPVTTSGSVRRMMSTACVR